MKLSSVLSLACFASFAAAGSPCGMNKHPGVLNAIGKFCQNQGMVIPSTYAKNGMKGAYDGGRVSIKGTCNPSQWVPQEYCLTQFKRMCSNGRKVRKFGRNKCQTWRIRYPGQMRSQKGGKKLGAKPSPQKPPAQQAAQQIACQLGGRGGNCQGKVNPLKREEEKTE